MQISLKFNEQNDSADYRPVHGGGNESFAMCYRDERGMSCMVPRDAAYADQLSPSRTLSGLLLERALSAGLTLATAESCTGGGIAADLTSFAGSSRVFLGSVVSYDNEVKKDLLGVAPEVLEQDGAVSPRCASGMLSGLLERIPAAWGGSVTGIAGPGGGTVDKPVGLVFTAAGARDGEAEVLRWLFTGIREVVREKTRIALCLQILQMMEEKLKA